MAGLVWGRGQARWPVRRGPLDHCRPPRGDARAPTPEAEPAPSVWPWRDRVARQKAQETEAYAGRRSCSCSGAGALWEPRDTPRPVIFDVRPT